METNLQELAAHGKGKKFNKHQVDSSGSDMLMCQTTT